MGMGAMSGMMGMGGNGFGGGGMKSKGGRQWGADDADAGAPPFKKARAGGADTGDPQKDELINRIKAFQRGGQEQKEAWWNYCDTHLGGNRDPARHDVNTLEDFAVCHGVP